MVPTFLANNASKDGAPVFVVGLGIADSSRWSEWQNYVLVGKAVGEVPFALGGPPHGLRLQQEVPGFEVWGIGVGVGVAGRE